MPELLLELFSEEIPARMQADGARRLAELLGKALPTLQPARMESFYGPRRIAVATVVAAATEGARSSERGPRLDAPEQALAGFLRKHGASREALTRGPSHWLLERVTAAEPAARVIAAAVPDMLRTFPWPKSMRWGGTSRFTWVRPLRRILCLLDGEVVPFDLRHGEDDGHGLASGNLTEGHRFHAPDPFVEMGPFVVTGLASWRDGLAARQVMVDAGERRRVIAEGIAGLAAARDLAVVADAGLLDEVAGLVEWPVPLLGRIDVGFMDLPAEVMQVSMRVNQRYFALRTADGAAAPFFAFAANVAAADGGAAIVAGNERVLRARFADARHFWDLDRRTRLADRVPALDAITFQAELGSQAARVARLVALAGRLAPLVGAEIAAAKRAALLAKADLTAGMVGEFPELQGVMGRYYALHDGEAAAVADAVRDHYAPRGPADPVPSAPVSVAAALADKLDTLSAFFGIGQRPTGGGDPFALRRAALGLIRIIRENRLRLPLRRLFGWAGEGLAAPGDPEELMGFVAERLRVQLRAEGARHDVLAAVFAAGGGDDLIRLLDRADAVSRLLATQDGADLLAAYRRAANILRIEEARDGAVESPPEPSLFRTAAEQELYARLLTVRDGIDASLARESDADAMIALATLRASLDEFFANVIVNDTDAALRRNRLCLLAVMRATMARVADFGRIEGA